MPRTPISKPVTNASVIAKGQRKASANRQANAVSETLRQGGRQFEQISDADSAALEKEAQTVVNPTTGKTAETQARKDSGQKREPSWKQISKKLDKTLDRIGKERAARVAKAPKFEPLGNSEDMSDDNLGKLRTALGNYHGAKPGSPTRETHRKQVHSLLRSAGIPRIDTSVRIPCAVGKCNGSGVLHPTAGENKNTPDATEYRCPAHVNDYETKDVWDEMGESETRKAENQSARNRKSYEKKKNAATISTELPRD